MIDKEVLNSILKQQTEKLKASIDNPSIFEKLKVISEATAFFIILAIDKEIDKLQSISTHMQVKGYDTTEINKWLTGYSSIQQNYFQVK